MNIKNLWCTKKRCYLLLCNTKMKFYFFWHVVLFLMLCNNKNISPWHNSFKSRKQKFGVAEKNFMFKKKFMLHKKMFHVSKNRFLLHKKKSFMSVKTGFCRTKKSFTSKKAIIFFLEQRAICMDSRKLNTDCENP